MIDEERMQILKYIEEEEIPGDVLDQAGLKKLILLLEKRILKNHEMRIKFPNFPEKFMDSELDLHDIIQQLSVIATVPDLYPTFVELNGVSSLLELLSHPNGDISIAVVDLIQEMTDTDVLHESNEGSEMLIEALKQQQACALLISNLERFNESIKEEADGVHNTLSIFENLLEIQPEICVEAATQGLINWILKRIKIKSSFDSNKLYASEILSILIQEDTNDNRLLLGNLEGIDVLLQQLAFYKRHDPSVGEEIEYMENLFNCLCSSMLQKENRDKFLKGEGLQLMNLMLREKKMSRNGALKVLDYALSGPDGKNNCNKFVEILGLRAVFPLFMKTPKKHKKRFANADEHEEHICSIIASLLRNCRGSQRQRLLSKFSENEFEKVDRLLELHIKYFEKVEKGDTAIDEENDKITDEDSIYLKRLSNGLFTLQLIDYIILEISATSDTIKQRIIRILNMHNASMNTIRQIMREYAGNLGDAGDQDWKIQEEQHIIALIDRF